MKSIYRVVEKETSSIEPYKDLYHMCLDCIEDNQKQSVEYLRKLSDRIEEVIVETEDTSYMRELYTLHKDVLKSAARYDFESYMLFIEWEREPKKKFFAPRRRILKPVVEALQELEDNPDLDMVAISLPPGVGKTTLAIFYLTWKAGKHPDEPKLMGSHSNSLVRGVYDECLRVCEPGGEYLWYEVFPEVDLVNTNAKDCRIDFGERKRFDTLEFTSIGTGNAGLYRAADLLYCDDLVSGIEVALSKERLDKLWEIYTTDLRQRKIGDHCKELHIATRWSVHDVIGRLEREYDGSNRAKFIVVPALNDKDESNFDYDYGVGFNTKFYIEQREMMDDVSWRAIYQNEPIEREGILYYENELRRYFELPDTEPDAILAVCDTKDKGTDYCAMPIAYKYGNDYYIEDFICDNSNPDVVETRLVEKLVDHKVHMARFESNSSGGRIAKSVQERVKKRGGRCLITTKYSTTNKETRIIVAAGTAKQRFLFKDKSKYTKEYAKAMNMLCGYTMAGKNKNDDVPDAIAMLVDYTENLSNGTVEIFRRAF